MMRVSDAFTFIYGSAGTGATALANREAFNKWKIMPRVLRNASNCNVEVIFSLDVYILDAEESLRA